MKSRAVRRRSHRRVAWIVLAACLSTCRDGPGPFIPDDRPGLGGPVPLQLTFSSGDERAPVWLGGGDSLAYSTRGFPPFPAGPGVLMKVAVEGGAADVLAPSVQFPGGPARWLTGPAPAPDGGRLAFVEMWSVREPELCPSLNVSCDPDGADPAAPRLDEIRVHVRERELDGGAGATSALSVPLEGLTFIPTPGDPFLAGFYRVRYHPFQKLFHEEQAQVFRPVWDPAGDRLVFSDGLRLLMWDGAAATATPVPGTDDGIDPAWSPDGQWIAFTRLERGDSLTAACVHSGFLGPVCRQERVVFPIAGRTVTLVRPDGSEVRELGPGEEPAWTPDPSTVVLRRANRLWTVSASGGAMSELAGTEGARDPAVSPDGSLLAYVRLGETGGYDLWVVPYPGGGP